jgi:hypothetical protein
MESLTVRSVNLETPDAFRFRPFQDLRSAQ